MKSIVATSVRGHDAETMAMEYLMNKRGMRLLDRNIEACGAEVDLIMEDKDTWVFVEVRAREHFEDVHPFETIDRPKQLKIIRVAKCYLAGHGCYHSRAARFDAVAVCLGTGEIEWIPNAFQW
jgi:putative endonuclease